MYRISVTFNLNCCIICPVSTFLLMKVLIMIEICMQNMWKSYFEIYYWFLLMWPNSLIVITQICLNVKIFFMDLFVHNHSRCLYSLCFVILSCDQNSIEKESFWHNTDVLGIFMYVNGISAHKLNCVYYHDKSKFDKSRENKMQVLSKGVIVCRCFFFFLQDHNLHSSAY